MLKARYHKMRLKFSLWRCRKWNSWLNWWEAKGRSFIVKRGLFLAVYFAVILLVGNSWLNRLRAPIPLEQLDPLANGFPFSYQKDVEANKQPAKETTVSTKDPPAGQSVTTATSIEKQPPAATPADKPASVQIIALKQLEPPIPGAAIQINYTLSTKWLTLNDWRPHLAVDFTAPAGAKVQAAADGTISSIKANDPYWGTIVVIDHGGGWATSYSNISNPQVTVGEWIAAGKIIGELTENPPIELLEPLHLHFILLQNKEPRDPTDKWR